MVTFQPSTSQHVVDVLALIDSAIGAPSQEMPRDDNPYRHETGREEARHAT